MTEHDALGEDFVRLCLRAAEHHPILKAVYLGPLEWLEDARRNPGEVASLTAAAHDLSTRAMAAGDRYIAGECRAVATQLEVLAGRKIPYDELVGILLGVRLAPPSRDQIAALRAEVVDLAEKVTQRAGPSAVIEWERQRVVTGEDKWDAALDTYVAGRRYALAGTFPIAITEGLDLIRVSDELWSVNLSWYPPRRLTFEVNVDAPRTPGTTAFEVAHNIYPGDYLHLAVLTQHTYGREGRVEASIKLKNAPENVIAEGIEDTAYLRLFREPTQEQLLVTRLEWLRRAASVDAALAVHVDRATDEAAVKLLMSTGFMDEGRARFQLRFIKHPLWGTYQYSYWAGRELVEAGDDRARRAGREREYLAYLYGGLHVPDTFLAGVDDVIGVAATARSSGLRRDVDAG
jgi:hypothetical protein